MSHNVLSRTLLNFALRHPVLGGLVIVALGVWVARLSIGEGTELARFVDGPRVAGVVQELRESSDSPTTLEMTASWRHGIQAHSGPVYLYQTEFERLSTGSRVELLLASDDPSSAMLAEYLARDKPFKIGGVWMTFMGPVAIAIILLGVGFALFGGKKSKDPAPIPRRSR